MRILGISGYYHDSAAALLEDGRLVAAAQEERFTRRRHDAGFPARAARWCLDHRGIGLDAVDYVAFYDKPLLKFERLLETYLGTAPAGLRSFLTAMPVWLKEKLYLKRLLRSELAALGAAAGGGTPPLLFNFHHQAHAASAFFASPFQDASVLCLDGVGDWATTSAWSGHGNRLEPHWEIRFPHSLGLLYSAFTYYTGFKVNSGEYKLMGLAPYGEPRFAQTILDHLVDVKDDGSFRLDMAYFDYASGLRMTGERFHALFGGPPRTPESLVTRREMDLASSVQAVTEEIVLKLARGLHREQGLPDLCLAGGVALNCVANGRLLREGPFRNLWVQPAAGDAGGAVGAAFAAWHEYLDRPRTVNDADAMHGGYLGPAFDDTDARAELDAFGARCRTLDDDALYPHVARLLDGGAVVGWFQGRMEFGPRALGARSILGDARNPGMQSQMNLKIKHRESFRPFAPAVLAHRVSEWFELDRPSPYMLLVAGVRDERRVPVSAEHEALFGIDRLNVARSEIPAATHVDYSSRIQTVHRETNPRFHALLEAFEARTGCPVLVNTSFNVRGEPIVCTPTEAYRCFMRTAMDHLVIGNLVLARDEQPPWTEGDGWLDEIEPD